MRGADAGVTQRPVAERVGLTRHLAAEVLHEERDTSERSVGEIAACLGPRSLESLVDHRIDRRVETLDAGDRLVDEFGR